MEFPLETDTGSGERLRLLGIEHDAEGEVLRIEGYVEPGVGPPMHVHFHQDEAIRVRKGLLGWRIRGTDGVERSGTAGPGEEVVFRAGEVHRFWSAGDEPLEGEGWVRPPGNFPWFISRLHESIRENGGERPGFFEGAFLSWRYRHEFDMEEIPLPVRRFVFPVVVTLGSLLGRYRKYRDAPTPAPAPAPAPPPSGGGPSRPRGAGGRP
jgi:mannose-6-phosphate isomerase-like protein (cupin superfamily)